MALLDYTTYDDIRAALGVSSEEIADATFSLSLYELNFVSELEAIDLDLASDFTTVHAIAVGSRTALQTRFHQSAQLFATYAVAKQATVSLALFSPKDVTDGKAGFSRYAADPYKETTKRVLAEFEKFRTKLQTAYAALSASTATVAAVRSFMTVCSPTSDPVLGT